MLSGYGNSLFAQLTLTREIQMEMQTCEHCDKDFPIEQTTIMDDCWFCLGCVAEFQKQFSACSHQWEPHTDSMGDAGQYCTNCSGFVRNVDMQFIAQPKP